VSARPQFLRGFEQRNGGDEIDTRLHRCAQIHQPPLSDEAHAHRVESAEEAERIERLHNIADRAIFVIFVLVLAVVLTDRYAHLLPGGGL
jgi:hypothetical protein